MNERDRMLAEGPRVAPEPPTADGFAPMAPADSPPRPSPSRPSPSPTASRKRELNVPVNLRRLIPLAVFGVVLASRAGAGKHALWVIVLIALSAILFGFIRKRRK
jgi:hypothetical protein